MEILIKLLQTSGIHTMGRIFRHSYTAYFLRKAAYTRYDVRWTAATLYSWGMAVEQPREGDH
jgi:hypothetical protein